MAPEAEVAARGSLAFTNLSGSRQADGHIYGHPLTGRGHFGHFGEVGAENQALGLVQGDQPAPSTAVDAGAGYGNSNSTGQ